MEITHQGTPHFHPQCSPPRKIQTARPKTHVDVCRAHGKALADHLETDVGVGVCGMTQESPHSGTAAGVAVKGSPLCPETPLGLEVDLHRRLSQRGKSLVSFDGDFVSSETHTAEQYILASLLVASERCKVLPPTCPATCIYLWGFCWRPKLYLPVGDLSDTPSPSCRTVTSASAAQLMLQLPPFLGHFGVVSATAGRTGTGDDIPLTRASAGLEDQLVALALSETSRRRDCSRWFHASCCCRQTS